jgi:hypothetical protein
MAITRDGAHCFVQLTGQAKFEVFAESERDYFLKVVDAQITVTLDLNTKHMLNLREFLCSEFSRPV